ncbi:MAG: hypothetical protein ACXAEB_15175 [Candidatus Thorarchaeota archaeon]
MIDRKLTASIMLIISIIGVGVVAAYLSGLNPDLSQVPPPVTPPGDEQEIVVAGDLELWADHASRASRGSTLLYIDSYQYHKHRIICIGTFRCTQGDSLLQ